MLWEGRKRHLGVRGVSLGIAVFFLSPAYVNAQLDEIVVTATKREQTLQQTPVAVSVVTENTIEQAEIRDLIDLQTLVPSLRVDQRGATASTNFFIHGFGNGAGNAGIEPSVGVFIDGVYRSRSATAITDLPNLQRIEVLRGPQSTLFGKNASAGVISIVTRPPQFEFGGSASATAGNFGTARFQGDVTGPLTDEIAISLSGYFNRRDGYADDLGTGQELNDRKRWGLRGQFLYEPTERLTIRVIGDIDEIDEACCLTSNIVSGPVTDGVIPLLGQFVDEDPFSYDMFSNFEPNNRIETSGGSLHIDYDFDDFTLTSITALRLASAKQLSDADATSADIVISFNEASTNTVTQEVRLTSDYEDGSPLDWMIGGFYFSERVRTGGEFTYGEDFRGFLEALGGGAAAVAFLETTLLGLPAGTIGEAGRGVFETRDQDNRAWSIFGTLDWHVTDSLTATAGLNFSDDRKEVRITQFNTDIFSGLDLPAIAAGLPAPFQPGVLAAAPFQFLPPFQEIPNAIEDGKSHDDQLTYTFRLSYDITDDINAYASYATGFKATSWNLSREGRPSMADFIALQNAGLAVTNLEPGSRFAGPEDAKVWEIGLKALFFDRLSLNLTLFDQTIEGFQSLIFNGVNFELSNAGEQSTRGIEIDTAWAVTDELTVTFAATILDPEFDSFINSPSGDISGQRPAGIPTLATSTSATYSTDIKGWPVFARADWEYSSPTDYFDSPTNQALIGFRKEFHLVNASAGVTMPHDVDVTFWGRNIFGEEYITGAFPSIAQSGSISGYANQPRTYGATVRKRF